MTLMGKKEESNVMLKLGFFLVLLASIRILSSWSILQYNPKHHLFLHITFEFFSVFISLFIAVQGWMVFHHTKSNKTLYLASLFFAVAFFDFFHTLSFDGMPYFITENDIEKATWFWIVARLTESFGLLFLLSNHRYENKKVNKKIVISSVLIYISVIISVVFFYKDQLPRLYIEGVGLTGLKIALEYMIGFAHLVTVIALYVRYKKNGDYNSLYLIQSLGFLLFSELIFAMYQNVHNFDNLLGHIYKVLGYYYLFKGIYLITFSQPYEEKTSIELDKRRIEEHFKFMVETISGAYIAIDQQEKIILANKSTYKLLQENENLVGQNLRDYYHARGVDANESRVLKALKSGKSYLSEKVALGDRVFLADAIPIIDNRTGHILGASTYFIDITNEENKILKQNELLIQHLNKAKNVQQILDSLPIGFLAINNQENILSINDEMIRNKSINRDELIGLPLMEYVRLMNLNQHYKNMEIIRALNGEHIMNAIHKLSDATYIINAHPLIDENSHQILGAIASYHNVTELENIREEIAKMEGIEMVSQMAASITHEIRNPMAAVRGFIQLLDEQAAIEQKNYYKIILSELDRANAIIKDFLSLSGNREIQKEEISLNTIIHEVYPLFMAEANMKGHELSLILDEEMNHHHLLLDKREIKQLLLNLVRNGLEAMEVSGKLMISTKYFSNQFILFITDTGIGIPEEALSKLFQPFFTTKKSGTGLGLSVCKSIVEKHNGEINVFSEEGFGTTFEIKFYKENH